MMEVMETKATKVSVSFSDKDHPVWGIVKPMVMTGCALILLYTNASHFDSGEVKTALGLLVTNFALEAFNLKRK